MKYISILPSLFISKNLFDRKNSTLIERFNQKITPDTEGKAVIFNSVLKIGEISDKLAHLLSLKAPEFIFYENRKGYTESTLHIAVIFAKQLIQNQITLEFSRRVNTLLNHIKYGKIRPDIIAFLNGKKSENHISGAFAGYIYFRNLSCEMNISLNEFEFIIEDFGTNSHKNLVNLLKTIKKKYKKEGMSRCHFTFISSDYHLIRISEVYKLSAQQSILTSLRRLNATWTYLFAAYPFCVSPDPSLAFLGRIRILANDLTIVLINLNSLVVNNNLLARENFTRLCETNRKLRSIVRTAQKPLDFSSTSTNKSIRISPEQLEVLEISLYYIYEIQSVLEGFVNGKNIDRKTLIQIRNLFMNVTKKIKDTLDPDRPIDYKNWHYIINHFEIKKVSKSNNVIS